MDVQELTIRAVHEEVPGFKTFIFEDLPSLSYRSGQYLTFLHKEPNLEIRRSYSIVSAPTLNEPLTIGVKRIENGSFSRLLVDRAKPGDRLLTTGAGGLFTLPEDLSSINSVFLLAAGSGITPIFSLIKTVLHDHPRLSVTLIYSTPGAQQTVFYHALQELAALHPRFHLRFLFSHSPDLRTARLNRDLLTRLLEEHSDLLHTLFFICGPESYMRLCTYVLQEEKVPADHIRRENFIIEKKPVLKSLPPDRETHRLTLHYQGRQENFFVTYPDTILQAAKKNGLSLPYSCETGRCGNCAARCLQGTIWLSHNEVLTDKDLAEGLTLTCVGHPVGGDAVIEIG